MDSIFDERHNLNVLKIDLADLGINIHFLNVFFVSLAFIIAIGVLFFFALIIKFGQISESTKKIALGFHNLKNLLIKKSTSIGKYL